MDIDLRTSGLERIVGADAPLDQIAHGLNFGEGPVWDQRKKRFLWTDIIGDTIYEWTPGVGTKALEHGDCALRLIWQRCGRLKENRGAPRRFYSRYTMSSRKIRIPLI